MSIVTRNRGLRLRLALVVMTVVVLTPSLYFVATDSAVAATTFSITTSGNHLIDGTGQAIQLRGVNESGAEYSCAYPGYAGTPYPTDQSAVDALKSWDVNVVRIPLNEACWLAIDGATTAAYSGQNYIKSIVDYVNLLNANGIYAMLTMQYAACGSMSAAIFNGCYANWEKAAPEQVVSDNFWASVATTFKSNHAVLFDLYTEPNGDLNTWPCWRDGGCNMYGGPTSTGSGYRNAGFQSLVNDVRNAGATSQPVVLGGLQYANDLSGFLAYAPNDPYHHLVASTHTYGPGFAYPCSDAAFSCYTTGAYALPPIAAQYPVIFAEFGEGSDSSFTANGTFDTALMNWADAHGISGYLAWTWTTWGCSGQVVIAATDGTPCSPNGVEIRNHYRALGANFALGAAPTASTTVATTTTVSRPPTTAPSGTTIGSCSGLRLLGKIDPPLPATPTPVVASLKTAKAGLSVYDVNLTGDPPISTTGGGTCDMLGVSLGSVVASAKLSGVASCNSSLTDASLYPLNGKLRLAYVGASGRLEAYVRVTGFDPSLPDVIHFTGLVTKGDGVGSTTYGTTFFDPVIKAAAGDPSGIPMNAFYYDVSQLSGRPCDSGGNPIANVYAGDGTSLLGSPADGISFSF